MAGLPMARQDALRSLASQDVERGSHHKTLTIGSSLTFSVCLICLINFDVGLHHSPPFFILVSASWVCPIKGTPKLDG